MTENSLRGREVMLHNEYLLDVYMYASFRFDISGLRHIRVNAFSLCVRSSRVSLVERGSLVCCVCPMV